MCDTPISCCQAALGHAAGSSEALLSGQKPPFRLFIRAICANGSRATHIRFAVSEAFVVRSCLFLHGCSSPWRSVSVHGAAPHLNTVVRTMLDALPNTQQCLPINQACIPACPRPMCMNKVWQHWNNAQLGGMF